jgi:hypothetical protein
LRAILFDIASCYLGGVIMHIGIIVLCSSVVLVLLSTFSILGYIAIQEDRKFKKDIQDARKARNFMRKYQEYINKHS